METETTSPQHISRRDALRRGALLGGAFVWAAPTVQSLGARGAFAQQNGTPEFADFCPAGEGGRITRLEVRYTGKGCDNLQPPTAAGRQSADSCEGETGALPLNAFIVIDKGNCGGGGPGTETYADYATAFDTVIDTGLGPSGNQACLRMRVYTDSSRSELLVSETIHTSCSAELFLGEQYGPMEIYDGDWQA